LYSGKITLYGGSRSTKIANRKQAQIIRRAVTKLNTKFLIKELKFIFDIRNAIHNTFRNKF